MGKTFIYHYFSRLRRLKSVKKLVICWFKAVRAAKGKATDYWQWVCIFKMIILLIKNILYQVLLFFLSFWLHFQQKAEWNREVKFRKMAFWKKRQNPIKIDSIFMPLGKSNLNWIFFDAQSLVLHTAFPKLSVVIYYWPTKNLYTRKISFKYILLLLEKNYVNLNFFA